MQSPFSRERFPGLQECIALSPVNPPTVVGCLLAIAGAPALLARYRVACVTEPASGLSRGLISRKDCARWTCLSRSKPAGAE